MPLSHLEARFDLHDPFVVFVGILALAHLVALLAIAVAAAAARERRRHARRMLASRLSTPTSAHEAMRLADAIGTAATVWAVGTRPPLPPGHWSGARTHAASWLARRLRGRPQRPAPHSLRRTVGCLSIVAHNSSEADLQLLMLALFSKNAMEIRSAAAAAIGRSADVFPGAVFAMATALRESVGLGTTTLGTALQRVLARTPDQIPAFASDPSPSIRRIAVACARSIAADCFERTMPTSEAMVVCRAALRDDDAEVRAEACRFLREDPTAAPLLTERLSDSGDGVRTAAAAALAAIGTPDAILAIARSLSHSRPQTLRQTLNAVASESVSAPVELLQWIGAGGNSAAMALACISVVRPEKRVVAALLAIVESDGHDLNLRRGAMRAIALLARQRDSAAHDRTPLERLLRLLDNETDDEILASAVDAIAIAGGSLEAAVLVGRIGTAGRFVRERIVEALALNAFVARRAAWTSAPTLAIPRPQTVPGATP